MMMQRKYVIYFTIVIVISGLCCALAAMVAGIGNRFGWWDFHTGIRFLKWAAYGEAAMIAGSLISLAVAVFKSKSAILMSLIGTIIGLTALAIPASMWMIAHRVPPIHDITTDTENTPKFVAIVKLRKDASNPVEYGGQQVAKLQRMAYPDIGPLIIDDSPARAFELAFETAQKMGWEIANADTDNGLIEATATTFWFGFKDDVAIRITAQEHGSRIDVRSVSRVGISDIGTNAKRIRTFVKLLKKIQSSHF
jgi:uncharacterized protein (DUF1499 family)